MNAFSERVFQPELMDRADANVGLLLRTVRQFSAINRLFSRAEHTLRREVVAPNLGTASPITVADVGAGGGDIMIRFTRLCRRIDFPVSITCIDNDPRILDYTVNQCRPFPEIDVQVGDVRRLDALGPFDYVFCNNLLHHFSDEDIPDVLRRLYDAARRGVIVSDICRSRSAYLGYALFAGAFLHRSFAGYDGRLSIRKGFSKTELDGFAEAAGIGEETRVVKRVPARLVLVADKRPRARSARSPIRDNPRQEYTA